MRVDCKKCKRNLTGEAIKMLEGKIERVVCPCEDKAKEVYYKQFDKFLAALRKYNGTTDY